MRYLRLTLLLGIILLGAACAEAAGLPAKRQWRLARVDSPAAIASAARIGFNSVVFADGPLSEAMATAARDAGLATVMTIDAAWPYDDDIATLADNIRGSLIAVNPDVAVFSRCSDPDLLDELIAQARLVDPEMLVALPADVANVDSELTSLLADGLVDLVFVETSMTPGERFERSAKAWIEAAGAERLVFAATDRHAKLVADIDPTAGVALDILPDTYFSLAAHLPESHILFSRPEAPAEVEQTYADGAYHLTWTSVDPAATEYFCIYAMPDGSRLDTNDMRSVVIPRVAETSATIPSTERGLRFAVSAFDHSRAESDAAIATPLASADAATVADEMTAPDIEISVEPGRVTIKSTQRLGTVDLFDIDGRRLMQRRFTRRSATLDISDFAPGVYLLRVDRTTHKIIR